MTVDNAKKPAISGLRHFTWQMKPTGLQSNFQGCHYISQLCSGPHHPVSNIRSCCVCFRCCLCARRWDFAAQLWRPVSWYRTMTWQNPSRACCSWSTGGKNSLTPTLSRWRICRWDATCSYIKKKQCEKDTSGLFSRWSVFNPDLR